MTDKKIKDIRINGDITKTTLIELGSDPELEGFLVFCRWKDGGYSTGWSNVDDRELAFSLALLDRDVKNALFDV